MTEPTAEKMKKNDQLGELKSFTVIALFKTEKNKSVLVYKVDDKLYHAQSCIGDHYHVFHGAIPGFTYSWSNPNLTRIGTEFTQVNPIDQSLIDLYDDKITETIFNGSLDSNKINTVGGFRKIQEGEWFIPIAMLKEINDLKYALVYRLPSGEIKYTKLIESSMSRINMESVMRLKNDRFQELKPHNQKITPVNLNEFSGYTVISNGNAMHEIEFRIPKYDEEITIIHTEEKEGFYNLAYSCSEGNFWTEMSDIESIRAKLKSENNYDPSSASDLTKKSAEMVNEIISSGKESLERLISCGILDDTVQYYKAIYTKPDLKGLIATFEFPCRLEYTGRKDETACIPGIENYKMLPPKPGSLVVRQSKKPRPVLCISEETIKHAMEAHANCDSICKLSYYPEHGCEELAQPNPPVVVPGLLLLPAEAPAPTITSIIADAGYRTASKQSINLAKTALLQTIQDEKLAAIIRSNAGDYFVGIILSIATGRSSNDSILRLSRELNITMAESVMGDVFDVVKSCLQSNQLSQIKESVLLFKEEMAVK